MTYFLSSRSMWNASHYYIRFVEILEFTHFASIFRFNKTDGIGKEKELFHDVKMSIVMELI